MGKPLPEIQTEASAASYADSVCPCAASCPFPPPFLRALSESTDASSSSSDRCLFRARCSASAAFGRPVRCSRSSLAGRRLIASALLDDRRLLRLMASGEKKNRVAVGELEHSNTGRGSLPPACSCVAPCTVPLLLSPLPPLCVPLLGVERAIWKRPAVLDAAAAHRSFVLCVRAAVRVHAHFVSRVLLVSLCGFSYSVLDVS